MKEIVVETINEPYWNYVAQLRLKIYRGRRCEWIVAAWAREDKAKCYAETFTSYSKAWKAYDNADRELESRYDWKARFDQAVYDEIMK